MGAYSRGGGLFEGRGLDREFTVLIVASFHRVDRDFQIHSYLQTPYTYHIIDVSLRRTTNTWSQKLFRAKSERLVLLLVKFHLHIICKSMTFRGRFVLKEVRYICYHSPILTFLIRIIFLITTVSPHLDALIC